MKKVQHYRFSRPFGIGRSGSLLGAPRKTWKVAIAVVAGVCLVLTGVQLLYGADGRVRPGVEVAGVQAGGLSSEVLIEKLSDIYDDASLLFVVGNKEQAVASDVVGVTPDVVSAAKSATEYPLWERLIPFTLFIQYGRAYTVPALVDSAKLQQYTKETLTPLCHKLPVNASVTIKDSQLVVESAVKGRQCPEKALRDQLLVTAIQPTRTRITVPLRAVNPAVSTEKAQQALARAETLINRQLTLTLLGATHQPERSDIASWLTFTASEQTGEVRVGTSESALSAYLAQLQKSIYIAPGKTIVTTVDGSEASRAVGVSGRGIDNDAAVASITTQLLAGDGTVPLAVKALAPAVVYHRTYTTTQAGLQALLRQLSSEGDVAISVQELGGRKWSASSNGDKAFVPASTYKLFVAYAVLKNMESGTWQWSTPATAGKNIGECFDTMIIHSDNACAIWFGETIGWKKITDMIHAIGISAKTSLYTRGGFLATTDDNALFLAKLQRGELLPPALTGRLLDVMKRQVYRAGIPAGASGAVADKVGFLDGYLHDSAIVDTPNGPYVLVIYTKGSSWGKIADMTRQIDRHLRY